MKPSSPKDMTQFINLWFHPWDKTPKQMSLKYIEMTFQYLFLGVSQAHREWWQDHIGLADDIYSDIFTWVFYKVGEWRDWSGLQGRCKAPKRGKCWTRCTAKERYRVLVKGRGEDRTRLAKAGPDVGFRSRRGSWGDFLGKRAVRAIIYECGRG